MWRTRLQSIVMGAPSLQEGLSPNIDECSWISNLPKQILRLLRRLWVVGEGHSAVPLTYFKHDFLGLEQDFIICDGDVVGADGGDAMLLEKAGVAKTDRKSTLLC